MVPDGQLTHNLDRSGRSTNGNNRRTNATGMAGTREGQRETKEMLAKASTGPHLPDERRSNAASGARG
ncbi:hypothetical protein V6N12_027766 [Hibiscus sabdariffa]|uniref:Uncharacterized protein n=1 Tax=Hibiscus sabdariffa TaxID=183260 RepID=A0ABR2F3Y3_9ROSI